MRHFAHCEALGLKAKLCNVSHLVEKFSYKLEVGVFRFLVDDTVPLLSHEQTNGNCQLVVDQRVLQTLRALAGVLDLKFKPMENFEQLSSSSILMS